MPYKVNGTLEGSCAIMVVVANRTADEEIVKLMKEKCIPYVIQEIKDEIDMHNFAEVEIDIDPPPSLIVDGNICFNTTEAMQLLQLQKQGQLIIDGVDYVPIHIEETTITDEDRTALFDGLYEEPMFDESDLFDPNDD